MAFDAAVADPAALYEAPGVVYSENLLAPGLRFFRCEAYRSTISTKCCAARFLKAEEAKREALYPIEKCRTCPTGGAHAGRGWIAFSRWYMAAICSRCGNGSTRIIRGRLCVSCYNRDRELKVGRNGRGNAPAELMQRPLREIELRIEVDGEVRRIRDRSTRSLHETLLHVMRVTKGTTRFERIAQWEPLERWDGRPIRNEEIAADFVDYESIKWVRTQHRCPNCDARLQLTVVPPVLQRCSCGYKANGEPLPVNQVGHGEVSGAVGEGGDQPARVIYSFRERLLGCTAIVTMTPLLWAA